MARYIIYYPSGATVPQRLKYVDDATGAPDANDDGATLGVAVGSLWLDTTNHRIYICESAATAAAVWTELTGSASSDLTTLLTDLSVTGAHTADRNDAATHDLTLTGNTTLTPDHSSPPSGEAIDLRVVVRQDGTGGRTLGFGGTITWAGGSAPTMPSGADEALTLGFLSVDDGATWFGYAGDGGGGTPATTVESETSFGLSAAVGTDTEYARQDHTHGSPANPVSAAAVAAVGYWAPLVDSGSGDLIRDEATNEVIMAFVPTP